jgi:hypothetical protein
MKSIDRNGGAIFTLERNFLITQFVGFTKGTRRSIYRLIQINIERFEALYHIITKGSNFWDVTLCRPVEVDGFSKHVFSTSSVTRNVLVKKTKSSIEQGPLLTLVAGIILGPSSKSSILLSKLCKCLLFTQLHFTRENTLKSKFCSM